MKTLLKNGMVVNVFTDSLERADVLMEDDKIIGVGEYDDADVIVDLSGKYVCPGFIDGHIHIESTMLLPAELARVCIPHGTTALVADPHEIANVCGVDSLRFMLQASDNLPMSLYLMLPSCVPATGFDESGGALNAEALKPFYSHPRVLGLAEMMNYPGVLANDPEVMRKMADALSLARLINGHAPLLTGRDLDRYIAAGIHDDHECSSAKEAVERVRKGQWVMIRQGTSARNLEGLLPLFDEPYSRRCLLVTDDKHPADLLAHGHIDSIIRQAVQMGKSAITGIRMATLQAAQCFELRNIGAVAPGYFADVLVLNDLDAVAVSDVYYRGKLVARGGVVEPIPTPAIRPELWRMVNETFHMKELTAEDFCIAQKGDACRVIRLVPDQLLTDEWVTALDFSKDNGVDVSRDILKAAVIERHRNTGHIGKGYIAGVGMKRGAIASSISHDSHNLVVIGANDADMALAVNRVRQMHGGCVVVSGGEIVADMPLPIAGLMTDAPAADIAAQNEALRRAVHALGVPQSVEPFMSMAFICLPVIPALKITTQGLVDVTRQRRVPLFVAGDCQAEQNEV